MTNTPDLSKLNFSDIKTSLTDYLKNQSIFSGYNFEGSTIQTLIDLLSYNTYYYAFYSNMISSEVFLDSAQRINSVVSLVKPLGYTVPGLKSASSKITTTNTTSIPEYTKFNGVFANSTYYSFYNQLPIVDSGTITEGILTLKKDISNSINYTNQSYMLDETDVDISTVRIYVTPTGGIESEWTNSNTFPNNEENIFYIERDGNIFTLQFGKENTLGKSLISTDIVKITYLISSGIDANGISSFSSNGITITDKTISNGGSDGPNLDLIKFAAPKIFSSQDRAVTKNDYYGLLTKNDMFTNTNDFIVYGGDELYPPKYGRVFVSYDPDVSGTPSKAQILEFLKTKNTLTVIPEHIIPKKIKVDVSIFIVFRSNILAAEQATIKSDVKSIFNTHVGFSDKFNNQFNFSEFKELVLNKYSNKILSITFNSSTFTTILSKMSAINEFSIENNISLFDDASYKIFTYNSIDVSIPASNNLQTVSLNVSANDIDAGVVNISNGYFRINSIFTEPTQLVTIKTSNSYILPIIHSLSTFILTII